MSLITKVKEELLTRALRYSGHKYNCDYLQPMWHKGPCDCGWAELEVLLQAEQLIPMELECQHCRHYVLEKDIKDMSICVHCKQLLCAECYINSSYKLCDHSPDKRHKRLAV